MSCIMRKWLPALALAVLINLALFSIFAWIGPEKEKPIVDRPKAKAVSLSRQAMAFPTSASHASSAAQTLNTPTLPKPPREVKPPPKPEPVEVVKIQPPPKPKQLKVEPIKLPPPRPEPTKVEPIKKPPPKPKPIEAVPNKEPPPKPKQELEKNKPLEEPPPHPQSVARSSSAHRVSWSSTGQKSKARAGQVDKAPKLLERVPPEYPGQAWQKGVTGMVVVRMLVDVSGRVAQISVLRSEPPGVFDKSVKEAVKKWRFKPGEIRKKPTPVWVVQSVKFRMPE